MEKKESNPKDVVGSKKVSFSTLPMQVMMMLSLALSEGGYKYGKHNYRIAGVRASVYFDALMRHMTAWQEGEDIDEESGLPHPIKAMACLAVLMDAQLNDMLTDDRPPKAKNQNWMKDLNKLALELTERYPNPVAPFTEVTHGKKEAK